jgi:hypothetical protein
MDSICLLLPAGEVIVPLDLLDYDSSFTPALLRAFGSFVIAANDEGELQHCEETSAYCCCCCYTLVPHNSDAYSCFAQPSHHSAYTTVSEQLMTRFGLPSVTIDGKMTRRGTLQASKLMRCWLSPH